MERQTKISYLAFALAGLLLAGGALGAMGTAEARYTMAAGGQLQLQKPEPASKFTSDILDDNNVVVLLEDMYVNEDPREVQVNIEITGTAVSGSFTCKPDNGYLSAEYVETTATETAPRYTVVLTPTDLAQELTEETVANIDLEWNGSLKATLQVTLLPMRQEVSAVAEEENVSEGVGDEPETSSTDGAEEALAEAVSFLYAMPEFDRNEYLGLQIVVPQYCDRLELELNGGGFPQFTRYSVDGGETFVLLYDSMEIELIPGEAQSMTVLIDLENAELVNEALSIEAYAYYQNALRGSTSVDTKFADVVPELESDTPLILNEDVTLVLSVPQNLGGAEAVYYLRRIDGTTDEVPVIGVDPENNQVILDALRESHRAKAGTYLLDIDWKYQGVTVAARQIAFYVNYTSFVQAAPEQEAKATEGSDAAQVGDPTESSEPTQATTTGGSES